MLNIMITLLLTLQQGESPSQIIYRAYVTGNMHLWEIAIEKLETDYARSGRIDHLYDLTLARYGYTGYLLGNDNKTDARKQISLAEENIEKLIQSPEYRSSGYSLQGAFYAYRISISPWQAVLWGRRSMNLIEKAVTDDPTNPAAWIEHGNAMFYAPTALGGSKTEAVKSYNRAVRLMENELPENQKWLYLNTLVSLAKSYQEIDNTSMAIAIYRRALEFEPEFKWVKDELLPEITN